MKLKSRLLSLLGSAKSSLSSKKLSSSKTGETPQQLLLDPPPIWSRVLIWSLSAGTFSVIIWASLNVVEETAQLPGQLETIRSQVSVKSPEAGTISQVDVRQHQYVSSGQLLMAIDREDILPRIKTLQAKLALINERDRSESRAFISKETQLKAQIALNGRLFTRLNSLYQSGASTEVQVLEKQNQLFQSRLDLQALRDEREKTISLQQIEKNDLNSQIRELQYRSKRFDIHSPISGSLQTLNVRSKGELVQNGELLAVIIPQEGLVASVQVSSRLSAPVTPGTAAEITVDAFPANDFGTLTGTITSISPTTSQPDQQSTAPAYVARIMIQADSIPEDFPPDALRSGMGITARVVLEKKRTISVVFNFIQDLFSPLNERR